MTFTRVLEASGSQWESPDFASQLPDTHRPIFKSSKYISRSPKEVDVHVCYC